MLSQSQLQVPVNSSYSKHNTVKHPSHLKTYVERKHKLQNLDTNIN